MPQLTISYSDDLLVASGKTAQDLEREMQFLLAVKMFELKRLSLGKAAELSGLTKLDFMDELGKMGIPVINLERDQVQDELQDA